MLVLHTLIDDACLFAGPDPCADHDEFPRDDDNMPSLLSHAKCFPRHLACQGYSSWNPFFVIIYIDISLPEPMGQGESFYLILFFPVTFSFQGIREILTTEFTILFN